MIFINKNEIKVVKILKSIKWKFSFVVESIGNKKLFSCLID